MYIFNDAQNVVSDMKKMSTKSKSNSYSIIMQTQFGIQTNICFVRYLPVIMLLFVILLTLAGATDTSLDKYLQKFQSDLNNIKNGVDLFKLYDFMNGGLWRFEMFEIECLVEGFNKVDEMLSTHANSKCETITFSHANSRKIIRRNYYSFYEISFLYKMYIYIDGDNSKIDKLKKFMYYFEELKNKTALWLVGRNWIEKIRGTQNWIDLYIKIRGLQLSAIHDVVLERDQYGLDSKPILHQWFKQAFKLLLYSYKQENVVLTPEFINHELGFWGPPHNHWKGIQFYYFFTPKESKLWITVHEKIQTFKDKLSKGSGWNRVDGSLCGIDRYSIYFSNVGSVERLFYFKHYTKRTLKYIDFSLDMLCISNREVKLLPFRAFTKKKICFIV